MIQEGEKNLYKKICNLFKVVFDVGSRDDINYYEINPNCEYHLFEPNPEFTNILKEKLLGKSHNVVINEFGFSDEESENSIYYKNTQSFKPHWLGFSIDSGDRFSLKKLDDYVENNKIEKIDFLKTDCEEFDEKVVIGGLKTIKYNNKVSFIQLEYTTIKFFIDLLDNFEFYLIIEKDWLELVNTLPVKKFDFDKQIIKLNDELINYLDTEILSMGWGGNIFGINKNKNINIDDIVYKINNN
jgi:FkbM family methyltransferase